MSPRLRQIQSEEQRGQHPWAEPVYVLTKRVCLSEVHFLHRWCRKNSRGRNSFLESSEFLIRLFPLFLQHRCLRSTVLFKLCVLRRALLVSVVVLSSL